MEEIVSKIGLGGGCHWCTEAVFQTLKGVQKVEQGYVASTGKFTSFSEAVIVHFNPEIISLEVLSESICKPIKAPQIIVCAPNTVRQSIPLTKLRKNKL